MQRGSLGVSQDPETHAGEPPSTEDLFDVEHDSEQRISWNDDVRIKKEADKKETAKPAG